MPKRPLRSTIPTVETLEDRCLLSGRPSLIAIHTLHQAAQVTEPSGIAVSRQVCHHSGEQPATGGAASQPGGAVPQGGGALISNPPYPAPLTPSSSTAAPAPTCGAGVQVGGALKVTGGTPNAAQVAAYQAGHTLSDLVFCQNPPQDTPKSSPDKPGASAQDKTDLQKRADDLKERAKKAQERADKAQERADKAQKAADEAQKAADADPKDTEKAMEAEVAQALADLKQDVADARQNAADKAQEKADAAQKAADAKGGSQK
jgi:hypothetical protein